ncbi:unnamed protein product [Macrosiphum euphorbiae]|nr:unnamed protein product [Macrosiphum euphorbiae]
MKNAKMEFSKAIKNAKALCWKQLCDQNERDPWGKPYKLVMGKLTKSRPPENSNNTAPFKLLSKDSFSCIHSAAQ